MIRRVLIVLFIVILISSCGSNLNKVQKATVHWNAIEGGFWGIITDNDEKLNPINLDDEFKVDGLRVKLNFKEIEDYNGIYMWGTAIEITNIKEY
jgi:hypothetical protein